MVVINQDVNIVVLFDSAVLPHTSITFVTFVVGVKWFTDIPVDFGLLP